jgi:hypothetical protein
VYRTIITAFFAALLSSSAVFASDGPCSLARDDEVLRVLRGAVVEVPADQMGEETAPYCLWATAGRKVEVKLTIWSRDELPVLNLTDAESYFVKLEAAFRGEGRVVALDGFGARAFEAGFAEAETQAANGTIVILKSGRVSIFDFSNVAVRDARAFAVRVAGRL